MRPVSHTLGSPVLNRTIVDDMNPCSLGSILEHTVIYATKRSKKIELTKVIHNKNVKTATTLEAFLHLFLDKPYEMFQSVVDITVSKSV